MWDPTQYGRYADERARPFHDLMAHVGTEAPSYVVDVGCGSGELTALLGTRWPDSTVEGVDSSAEMLARAPSSSPRLRFTHADARTWRPERPVDLLVSSATMQWVDDHEQVLRELVACLAPGGWLALQVPGNFAAPSHVLLREAVARWLPDFPMRSEPVLDPAGYASVLSDAGCRVDAWETTYLQILAGTDPVLEWVKGTALRPVLAALPVGQHAAFLAEYGDALRSAYTPGRLGTLFPFRRVFAVAHA